MSTDFSAVDNKLRELENLKEAFVPSKPAAAPQGAPLPGGMPPEMMGGGGAPMPPEMMGGGGAPMPPEMMGGGGAPMSPEMGGAPEGMMMVNADELKQLFKDIAAGKVDAEEESDESGAGGSQSASDLSERVKMIETQLSELMSILPALLPMVGGGMGGGMEAGGQAGVPQGQGEMPPAPPVPEVAASGASPDQKADLGMIQDLISG